MASPALLTRVNDTEYAYASRPNGVDLTEKDANGAVSRLRLDFRANESTLRRPDGSELNYQYFSHNKGPAAGKLARVTSGTGVERLRIKYDAFGDVIAVKRGEAATTLFAYDEAGRLVRREQIGRPPTVWSYPEGSRQPVSVTNAAGDQVRFRYDTNGDLLEMEDLRGEKHRFHYDALGRMTRHDYPLGYHRTLAYDDWGRVVRMTDLDGTRTEIAFGENGRVAALQKGVHRWAYTYALTGELAEVHRNGRRILDRSLEPLVGGDWRLLLRDVHGAETEKRYDADGRLVATRDALDQPMSYTYDPVGRLAGWTDPRGGTVRFKRDPLGRITLVENSLGQGESRRYDKAGRLIHRDNGEQQIDYAYDEAGHLTESDYGNGEGVEHRYDAFGRVTETTAGEVSTRYRYDVLDRVTLKATRLPDGSVHSVGYAYTPAGQKAAVRYFRRAADQVDPTLVSETTHEYDALGRLLRIAVDGEPKVLYQYDPASLRLAARHFASGQRLAYSYDRMGRTTLLRVTDAAGDLVERVSYSWSPDGRLAERVREGRAVSRQLGADPPDQIRLVSGLTPAQAQDTPVRLIQHYHYDPLGRLAAVTYPGLPHLDEAYTYDASGNLLEKAIGDETQAFTYDLANQLKSRRDADGILTRYRYDQAGRMTTELVDNQPVATYAYGYRDRVLELVRHELGKAGQVEGGSAVRFHYDGAGMIVGKQRGSLPAPGPQIARAGFGFSRDKQPGAVDYAESAIEAWVWEDAFGAGGAPRGAQALLARGERTWANAPHASGEVPVVGSAIADEDETVFISDFLGNTLLTLPGEAATTVAKGKRATTGFSYLTTAHGVTVDEESDIESARFTGKPYDEDLEAHVFPYRNYATALGRWTSADPLGFPDGPNRHFYAPVPTLGLDPLGLVTRIAGQSDSNYGYIFDSDLGNSFG
ncbi:MAG: RHS repeat-associated core domain-containing protein, partial [Opitutales bacterium]